MKVVDLINKLNEIGYDENTELTLAAQMEIQANVMKFHLMKLVLEKI